MMLKRLQMGFIGTNMVLIGIVLCVVFTISYANSYSGYILNIDKSLRNSIEFVEKNRIPLNIFDSNLNSHPSYRPNNNIATVTVTVNSRGEITSSFQDLTRISPNNLNTMVAAALPMKESRGFIEKKSFRYLKIPTDNATYISFADMSQTQDA